MKRLKRKQFYYYNSLRFFVCLLVCLFVFVFFIVAQNLKKKLFHSCSFAILYNFFGVNGG